MASSSPASTALLFLNVPPETFLGIDLLSFDSSPNFHGISDVPSGLHFLYSGTDASLAIRHGRWLDIVSDDHTPAHVLEWSGQDESLEILKPKSSEALAAISAIPSLRKRGLIDYNALSDASSDAQAKQDALSAAPSDWLQLSTHITSTTLSRILTIDWTLTSVSSASSDTEHIPGLTDLEASSELPASSTLDFTPINLKQTWPDDAIGRDRTDKARDRSWYLEHLIETIAPEHRQTGAKELLGELQICFLLVLTLANYSCLEQWKRLLTVVFTCQKALTVIEGYFVEVLKILRLQMEHVDDVDGGLFDLKDEQSSAWLRQLISKFRGSVEEVTTEDSEVRKQLDAFETFMQERYGWESGRDVLKRGMLDLEDGERVEVSMDGADEDDESGEYAPVVVET